MRIYLSSVRSRLSGATWKSWTARSEAYMTLFRSIVPLLLSACRGEVTIKSASLAWVQPFWGMASCHVVTVCLLSRGDTGRCKPFASSCCLPTLRSSSVQSSVHKSFNPSLVLRRRPAGQQLQWHKLLRYPWWGWWSNCDWSDVFWIIFHLTDMNRTFLSVGPPNAEICGLYKNAS